MKNALRFVKLFLLPHKGLFVLALLTGLVAAGASGLGIPLMISAVFPILFSGADSLPPFAQALLSGVAREDMVLVACLFLPFMFGVRALAMWGNAVIVNLLTIKVLEDVRMMFFSRVQSLPLAFLESQRKGDLISRLMTDTQKVQILITNVSNEVVKQPITCVSALVAFFFLIFNRGAGWDFVANLFFVILAAYPVYLFGKRIAKKSTQAQEGLGELTTIVQQNLETQREIRAYAMEDKQVEAFTRVSEEYNMHSLKLIKYQKALIPVMETVTALALSFLLVKGKLSGMTLNDFLALAAALFMAFSSMKRSGRAFNRFSEAQGSLLRLVEILDVKDTIPEPACPKDLERAKGDILFENVSFAYRDGGAEVLSNVNIHIPAGQVVGLVGVSGAGKSSFAQLIPRFYEVSQGAVKIDGIDVRDWSKHQLREQIALVGQHALLFACSIEENVALGREGASEEEIALAMHHAQVEGFLDLHEEGKARVLGEGGNGLSGGQRQRVAIARAFLKDAPILILDEATASLDAKSEKAIQLSLEALAKGRTSLIIAHRFSTIRHADRILLFDKGRVVADGSHEDLYEGNALYRDLYDRQGGSETLHPV